MGSKNIPTMANDDINNNEAALFRKCCVIIYSLCFCGGSPLVLGNFYRIAKELIISNITDRTHTYCKYICLNSTNYVHNYHDTRVTVEKYLFIC